MRTGLRLILESADDITVVGEAEDGADAVDAVRRCPTRTSSCSTSACRGSTAWRPPSPSAVSTTRQRVLILTTFDVDDHVLRALQAGADGFLLKDTPPTAISSTPSA